MRQKQKHSMSLFQQRELTSNPLATDYNKREKVFNKKHKQLKVKNFKENLH